MPDGAVAAPINPMSGPGDSRPVPDPTILTSQLVDRAIAGLEKSLSIRLDAMDKATELLNANMTRVPTDTDKQIGHLKELHDEKFSSIEVQFRERDTRTEQTSRDSKTAVDAALQAAKEAVGQQTQASDRAIAKSEAATNKTLDQLGIQLGSTTKALDDKIADLKDRQVTMMQGATKALDDQITNLKERLTLMEGRTEGQHGQQTDARSNNSFVLSVVMGAVGILSLLISVAIFAITH